MAAQPIESKAAVAWSANQPLKVQTIIVDPPKAREVRIKILHTSVCHTDQYTLSGSDPEANFPCILGHEAAGIVESIGEGVVGVKVGDYVVPLYTPQCGECKFCRHPKSNHCNKIRDTQGKGVMPDGTSRFKTLEGETIFHYMGTSTMSEYSVLADISVAKICEGRNLEHAALLGCGLSTGYGAAVKVADVQAGETVAIFGLGTVGLAVALGCKSRGASRILGIDINDKRLEESKAFGVTETFNPKNLPSGISLQEKLVQLTGHGFDHTFECVGNVNLMRSALESAHRGWGQCVIIGVAGAGQELCTRPFNLITGRQLKGCAFGGWKSRLSVPELLEMCDRREIDAEKFITHRKEGLESLNEAFELLNSGQSLRCLIKI